MGGGNAGSGNFVVMREVSCLVLSGDFGVTRYGLFAGAIRTSMLLQRGAR